MPDKKEIIEMKMGSDDTAELNYEKDPSHPSKKALAQAWLLKIVGIAVGVAVFLVLLFFFFYVVLPIAAVLLIWFFIKKAFARR